MMMRLMVCLADDQEAEQLAKEISKDWSTGKLFDPHTHVSTFSVSLTFPFYVYIDGSYLSQSLSGA